VLLSGALIVLTALIFGTGPALVGGRERARLASGERAATGGGRVRRTRSALAIAELALAMTLLVTAGLLVRSLRGVLTRDPGYEAERLLVMDLWLPSARYPDLAAQESFHEQLRARVAALPGAEGVSLAGQVPPVGGFQIGPEFQAEGEEPLGTQPLMVPNVGVDTSFFRVLGIDILEGRGFGAGDVANGERVAVIDRDLARALWPDGSALGRRFRTNASSEDWLTVVGIANDVEMLGVADLRADECRAGACDFEVYRPLTQYQRLGQQGVAIRTTGDPLLLVQPVREIM
jgi:hypothetical protein